MGGRAGNLRPGGEEREGMTPLTRARTAPSRAAQSVWFSLTSHVRAPHKYVGAEIPLRSFRQHGPHCMTHVRLQSKIKLYGTSSCSLHHFLSSGGVQSRFLSP
eukprot:2267935-Pleurochrysis_carterae.AAC.1